MPRHDIMAISQLKNWAEAMVSLAAKASVFAHLSYDAVLNREGGDVERALRGFKAKLASVRREMHDLARNIDDLLGDSPPAAIENDEHIVQPAQQAASPYDRLVTATRQAGEMTNARAQKLLEVDAGEARKLLKRMVREGVVVKSSRKLFTLAQPQQGDHANE